MTENHGSFSGEPRTLWLTESNSDRKMQLLEDFSFTDPAGRSWLVQKFYKIDGASIPKSLWSLIGSPYTGDYRRASIVHDKACDDAAGNPTARRTADRMFFHACRAGGCTIEQATTLYLGVRIGSLGDQVPLWSAGIQESFSPTPRTSLPPAERRLESDFRIAAQLVFEQEITDDPLELESRVDAALSRVMGT